MFTGDTSVHPRNTHTLSLNQSHTWPPHPCCHSPGEGAPQHPAFVLASVMLGISLEARGSKQRVV